MLLSVQSLIFFYLSNNLHSTLHIRSCEWNSKVILDEAKKVNTSLKWLIQR